MRIAVTGAAGRLGRHFVARAMLAGHEIIGVDLPAVVPEENGPVDNGRAEWRAADLTVLDEVRGALEGAQAVAHFAGLLKPDALPEPQVHAVNVGSTYNVLLAAEEHGVSAVCTASSVNAIGGIFSRQARYDRFPVDEEHPSYCEDAYSLSKWVGEQQAAAFARRRPEVPFSALRLHALRADHAAALESGQDEARHRDLWGWVSYDSASAAVLRALHRREPGFAVYNVVATRTMTSTPSADLAKHWFPQVPVDRPLTETAGFYSMDKALAELGWDASDEHPAISDDERATELLDH